MSGTLPRSRATTAGERAKIAAASTAAGRPTSRVITRNITSTAAIPSITCGATTAHGCGPNMRTDSAWGHRAPGSLSMVIVAAGSNAAKKKLCQLTAMLRSAAA